MRNLFGGYNGLTNLAPQSVLKRNTHISGADEDKLYGVISQPKKAKIAKQEADDILPLKSSDRQFSVPLSSSPFKSPRKYSDHINKLLASPKRNTRSSVITQNYTYTPNLLFESPTRRSTRLQEREQLFLTPPLSGETCTEPHNDAKLSIYESPNTRSRRSLEPWNQVGLFTPESGKSIPFRSAKRSLDAIIQAIDQIEKA